LDRNIVARVKVLLAARGPRAGVGTPSAGNEEEMVYCERCGASFSSMRAATLRDCPRCLLRDDIAAPLVARPPDGRPVESAGSVAAVRSGATGHE
jgi:hypothetical protein